MTKPLPDRPPYPRRGLLRAAAPIAIGAVASFAPQASASTEGAWTEHRYLLQRFHGPDRSTLIVLTAVAQDRRRPHFDFDRHAIRDVRLRAWQSSVADELGASRETAYKNEHEIITAGRRPTWENETVIPGLWVLPSSRVVCLVGSGALVVEFDGARCQSQLLQIRVDKTFNTEMVAEPSDPVPSFPILRDFYQHAFAPEDVHWSYALVTCAEHFGYRSQPPRQRGRYVLIDEIYDAWRAIRSGPRV